jgi:acetyl-CoA C-acetyltransferase
VTPHLTSADPARIPVIVGVGQVNDRPVGHQEGMDSVQLMVVAARAADEDAGGGLIAHCDWLGCVPQIPFRDLDLESLVPAALGRDLREQPAHPVAPIHI